MNNSPEEPRAALADHLKAVRDRGPGPMIARRNGKETRVAFDADPVTFATLETLRTGYGLLLKRSRVSTTLLLRHAIGLLAADLSRALADPEAAADQLRALEGMKDR